MTRKQIINARVEFVEFFKIIWSGKWTIATLALLAGLSGLGYSSFMTSTYVVKISLSGENLPPYTSVETVLRELEDIFRSNAVSESLDQNSSDARSYSNFISKTHVVAGNVMLKSGKDNPTQFIFNPPNKIYMLLKTEDPEVVNGIHTRLIHAGKFLNQKHAAEGEEYVRYLEAKLKLTAGQDFARLREQLIYAYNFVFNNKLGKQVFKVDLPETPTKIEPNKLLIFLLCCLLGGTTGVVFVALRSRFYRMFS